MLNALTLILLVFQLIGEVLAQLFALPVPGPVIGMALLFVALALRGGPSVELRDTAQNLLQHLSLLFVPAGVGVMLHFPPHRRRVAAADCGAGRQHCSSPSPSPPSSCAR
jgi:holin-like protein